MEVEIHNGQVLVDGKVQEGGGGGAPPSAEPVPREPDLGPEAIAAAMARCVSEFQLEPGVRVPMELVNRLLTLRSLDGQKLVWTKWDVNQVFLLWSKKVEGGSRL